MCLEEDFLVKVGDFIDKKGRFECGHFSERFTKVSSNSFRCPLRGAFFTKPDKILVYFSAI